MAEILQNPIFTQFIFPFALIFFILFGILEKTKVFGEGKKQLNALIAAVVGLIFVGAVSPKLIVGNLILFLTVAIVVVFIGLLLWGFVAGEKGLKFEDAPKGLKALIGAVVVLAVAIALLWALGVQISFFEDVFAFLFKSSWSSDFWTNAAFIIVVIMAVALVVKGGGSGGK